ncbi:MAG: mevalonate kinase [Methanocellales archaeon]
MKICSAPGKIYFFGEHAVVYGENAVACAIDLRTRVKVEVQSPGAFEPIILSNYKAESYPYVVKAIERINEFKKISSKIKIEIKSQIPVEAHLGSSAAVTVATLAALNAEFKLGLNLEEIAKLGHEVEYEVQGAASPTDTYVSTFGGIVVIPERKRLSAIDVGMVIGDSNKPSSTKEMIARVRNLNLEYPEIAQGIIKTIGSISKIGLRYLERADYQAVGRLMNMNQGLLEALGVSTEQLSAMCSAARKAGAYGAKLTGAGGGGCMIAICSRARVQEIISAISSLGCKAIETRATNTGVMIK